MSHKSNETFPNVLSSSPQMSNIFNITSNSRHKVGNIDTSFPTNMNIHHVPLNFGNLGAQVHDVLAHTFSSIPPIDLTILVKLDDDNYLI